MEFSLVSALPLLWLSSEEHMFQAGAALAGQIGANGWLLSSVHPCTSRVRPAQFVNYLSSGLDNPHLTRPVLPSPPRLPSHSTDWIFDSN